MSLDPGTRLGSYEVVSPLGAGGMGEVYRARDTKLERHVALKLVIDSFVADPDRAMRFEREAKTLAALNHPNIATLHGLEQADGRHFLVMELVEGETLAERIARQPRGLAVEEALRIAIQIADALEAAHDKGIIHRDLKPANVKITPDDTVKVLDFGLARVTERAGAASSISLAQSPTFTSPAVTNAGVILGTAPYMSPEQARGYAADHRSDIFSFGIVLYEMLTGRQPFPGDTISDVLASVLAREPDLTALPGNLSPRLGDLLRRCFEKNAKKRWQAIGDVRYELESLLANPRATPSATVVTAAPTSRMSRLAQLAAAVLVGAAIAGTAAWLLLRTPEPLPRVARFRIDAPALLSFASGESDRPLAISPDGRHIVYAAITGNGTALMLRPVDRVQETMIEGTTSGRSPFFSPDGKWIAFFTSTSELRKIPIGGGPATTIGTTRSFARGATWGDDGSIVFGTGVNETGLMRIRASGGNPESLTKPNMERGEIAHRYPSFLPGAQALLYTAVSPGAGPTGLSYHLMALDLKTGTHVPLVNGSQGTYVHTGHLLYSSAGTLQVVAFDPRQLKITGEPFTVSENVATSPSGAAAYVVSTTGTLVHAPRNIPVFGAPRSLVWVDRQGREEPIAAQPRAYFSLRLSPDATRVALDLRDQDTDIWVWDIARRTLERLTFEEGPDIFPVWTHDGRHVIYRSARNGPHQLFRRPADGTGSVETLTKPTRIHSPTDVTRDGARVIFTEIGETQDIMSIPLAPVGGERPMTPLVQTRFQERNGVVSPNGRWLAYESDQTKTFEIYVRPFPDTHSGQWQISQAGGTKAAWSRDGRELFYVAADNTLMSVPITDDGAFKAGEPRKLFGVTRVTNLVNGLFYAPMPDGKRFILIKETAQTTAASTDAHIIVVLGWTSELRGR